MGILDIPCTCTQEEIREIQTESTLLLLTSPTWQLERIHSVLWQSYKLGSMSGWFMKRTLFLKLEMFNFEHAVSWGGVCAAGNQERGPGNPHGVYYCWHHNFHCQCNHLLAFHQVDIGVDLSWNASTKRGQITVKSCSWVKIEFEFRFYNSLVMYLRVGN